MSLSDSWRARRSWNKLHGCRRTSSASKGSKLARAAWSRGPCRWSAGAGQGSVSVGLGGRDAVAGCAGGSSEGRRLEVEDVLEELELEERLRPAGRTGAGEVWLAGGPEDR